MSQSAETESNVLAEFALYVSNKANTWQPERYLPKRVLNGQAFGKESSLSFQYVLGNAYLEGYIGDVRLRIFYRDLQGFQVYTSLKPPAREMERPATFHPSTSGALDMVKHVGDEVARLSIQ